MTRSTLRLATLALAAQLGFAASHPVVARNDGLRVEQDEASGRIEVFRGEEDVAILTQNARADFRPYLHPIVAPDGRGLLTEFSPGHHRHQTGLYWGFTRVNGRDYFHHPEGDYWRRVDATITKREASAADEHVEWRTVYDLLDAEGAPVLRETQTWSMRLEDARYVLDLVWEAQAQVDVTIGEYDYGGLFLRMPWRAGMRGGVRNSMRQADARAEGQRAVWLDVGLVLPERDDMAHISIFDHPSNDGFPLPWRVDGQLGVGPARARLGDWNIAAGESAVVKHRLLVHTGALDDLDLTERWSDWSGQYYTHAQWGLAQREGRAAEFLSPEAAVAAMTLPADFEVQAFASEPMITQPMAFCWDDRGRLWIAENKDYESRGAGFSGSGESRILILEDTDRDGVADTRSVFAEGIAFPSAIAVGFGGLWLGAPPQLLFLPDRDGDDRADMQDVEVHLTGWGIRDRHETLNSFHWGPDGWLYGLQGFATPSQVGRPAEPARPFFGGDAFPAEFEWADEPVEINGGVWRYHPTRQRFEVVAHGFSNPWGIDHDAKGQLFITACVIPHLWHVIPGGIYERQGGSHFNPYVYDDIDTIVDHRHRSAHGGARVYLSDAFPDEYHGRLFMANIHEHAVLSDVLERRGSGFVGAHGDDFLLANNAQWVGFSVEIGPDGALYVLDWHDAEICGNAVSNGDTGRVFRIAPKESGAEPWDGRYEDLHERSDAELVALQTSASAWHARRARLILQQRAVESSLAPEAVAALWSTYADHPDPDVRLRAMWALHVTSGLEEEALLAALHDDDEHVRAWAVQLACEELAPSEAALLRFAAMAASDPSPVVRLYLAAALQRMPLDARWPIADGLVTHAEDAQDHNLPKLTWFGIEAALVEAPELALALALRSRIPILTRHIARRLADAELLEPVVATLVEAAEPGPRAQLLFGLRDGLEGRVDVDPPPGWSAALQRLQALGGEESRLSLQLAQQFGSELATESLLASLRDPLVSVEIRREALRSLAEQSEPGLEPLLLDLMDQAELQHDAIRAAAAYDSDQLGEAMLARYAQLGVDARQDVVHTMATRSGYGWQLTRAIEREEVPRRDLPPYLVRALQRVVGNGFLEVWGALEPEAADEEATFARYRALLDEAALELADPGRGRVVFERTCLSCHVLYEEGGQIGPELTGANRSNLEYLLGNVLTPNAVIQDAYRAEFVLTDEGRVWSGIPVSESERQLRLRVPNEPEPVVIARSTIASRYTEEVSMMPEGLLVGLSEREVLDLFAYLRTSEQVPLPEDD